MAPPGLPVAPQGSSVQAWNRAVATPTFHMKLQLEREDCVFILARSLLIIKY